jgi:hypothetical protein
MDDGTRLGTLGEFHALYNEIQVSITKPALKGIMDGFTREINVLADSLCNSSVDSIRNDQYPPDAVQAQVASKQTDSDSSQICQMGNNQDSGVHCI